MDPINSFLGRLLLEEITPVVMVLSTPLAEEACRKNGLNFVEMLHPFSLFNKLDVPVRTASDQPYRLQMFKLRLVYASDIHQQHYEAAEERLKEVVSDASEKILSDLQSDLPQLETILSISEADSRPLWIQTFNKELIRTLSFSEHEAFDHPVACLLVVSSEDEQPINRFVDLFNTDQLPSLLNDGAMDPKILKHYLLLHDNLDGTPERAANILAEMRSTFGLNDCRLLSVNSAQDEDGAWKDNPWVPYKTNSSLNQNIARYLNMENADEIKDFMQDLSSKHIIPHMEQKIRILNQQVSATRKGFRNQIKNLWWRKGKEDMPDTPNGPIYSFSSIESQMRILGDYAFMLRDYELALSNYRLLSTDYKLDKAWKRYAGVQEMLGLSYFMLDQSRKEAEYCMENAFNTYMKLGSSGQRNATRCGLWWAEMLKAREQYREAASIYFRISNEEPSLHAAVLLEQASYCYVLCSPPMLRKYGFHLVLAGNRYYISDQRQHSIRTYRNAVCVYKGHAWKYIRDHVHFNIGRWYAFRGMFDLAIKHMLEVLACSHQSLATQDLFLNDFLHTAQNMGKTYEVYKLQLPIISMSSLKVVYEDHRTYASSSDIGVREELWQSLEEEMVPSTSTVRSNWLESQPKLSSLKKSSDSSVCVVGEAIKLDLEFKNPLQISISASDISLICELSARSEATEIGLTPTGRSASDTEPSDYVTSKEFPSCRDLNNDASYLTLSEENLKLGGGETKRVQLDVTPKVEGMLKIVGVRWTLSGSVVGYQFFEFDTKKKQKKRKGGTVDSLRRSNLNFVVIKGLPKLEACIHNLPEKVHAGDLRLLKLELRNYSEYCMKKLKMKISHPRFLMPGSSGELEMHFPSCLVKQKSSENKDIPANTMEKSKGLLFSFPHDVHIQGGGNLTWPLWFHAGPSRKMSLYISIYYEIENCSSDMTYRTLRMHYDLEVLPSLDVSLLITPCPSRWQEFLVRMDIVNRSNSHNVRLHQLSSVGNQWEISLLPSHVSICPSQMLLAGQAVSCFFQLKDCRKGKNKENELSLQRSDVLLGSQEREEALVDICRSPLADFHHHERLHQAMPAQGHPSSVDFILISKIQEDNPDIDPGLPLQLLSYHACYCSITSKSPIWWLMDGPRIITHDFSNSFCETSLHLTVHNSSESVASVKIVTSDSMLEKDQSSNMVQISDALGSEGGWRNVSLTNDIKVPSLQGSPSRRPSSDISSPIVWCALSSTQLRLGPDNTTEVPLKVFIFSPGTYDLSNYEVLWKLHPSDGEVSITDVKRWSSGRSLGHPFYLTVLQSTS